MATRQIGRLEVSDVGLGCNNFGMRIDLDATRAVVSAALDDGITFFDTADTYGGTASEEYLGAALGTHRADVVVATKFGMRIDDQRPAGASAGTVRRRLEDSLRRLGTDYVDLYQLHRPDPETPIADTLAEMDEQVRRGTVREIGCSNFSAAQLREAAAAVSDGAARFVSVQNEYSLLQREPELGVLDVCRDLDVAFLPFFPLASGALTGKYRRGEPAPPGTRYGSPPFNRMADALSDERMARVEALADVVRTEGKTLVDLAIGWLLTRDTVASVIAGATSPEQVHQNAAAGSYRPGPEVLAAIDDIVPPPAGTADGEADQDR